MIDNTKIIEHKIILIYKSFKRIYITIFLIYIFLFFLFYIIIQFNIIKKEESIYDINFSYYKYERNIINNNMIKNAHWRLTMNDAYFINGIIRKIRPKNCLEIGVADGGSSILILNAIKDIKGSLLISLDLYNHTGSKSNKKIGNRVEKYFPELMNKWKLFTGDLPHKFLEKINMKFDFVFIDTAHEAPGEILNFIEALPFLNENCVVVIHDVLWHFTRKSPKPPKEVKFTPSSIYLISSLYGDKIIFKSNNKNSMIGNTGAVFLYKNQKRHYIDYFLLLNSFWEYMPSPQQLNYLKKFIKKYYKNDLYLKLFENSINFNLIYINKFQSFVNECIND